MALPFELSVQEYASLRDSEEKPFLLDVREPDEYATAKISGSVHLPMGEITAKVQQICPDKEQRIIVHCHHGMRSAKVTEYMQKIGYTNVQNLAGGIDAWSTQIDPSVPIY